MAQIESRLKLEEAAYAQTMFEFTNRELENLRKRIAAGTLTISNLPDSFKYADALRRGLMEIVMRVRNFGQDQVKDELARQGA